MTVRRNHSDLREFVKENERRAYDFCFYMGLPEKECDEVLIEIFREFGETHRRLWGFDGQISQPMERTLLLFQTAKMHIEKQSFLAPNEIELGRDTRHFSKMESDLIGEWEKLKGERDWAGIIVDRLRLIEIDFRFPVVLRDILKFEDEESAQILGLRWGVYRQRLHRGRRECAEKFRGPKWTTTESRKTTGSSETRPEAP